jgi:hypothetical protein
MYSSVLNIFAPFRARGVFSFGDVAQGATPVSRSPPFRKESWATAHIAEIIVRNIHATGVVVRNLEGACTHGLYTVFVQQSPVRNDFILSPLLSTCSGRLPSRHSTI